MTAVDGPQHAERLRAQGASSTVGPLDLDAGPGAIGGSFDVVVNHVRLSTVDLAKLTAFVADGRYPETPNSITVTGVGPVTANRHQDSGQNVTPTCQKSE